VISSIDTSSRSIHQDTTCDSMPTMACRVGEEFFEPPDPEELARWGL